MSEIKNALHQSIAAPVEGRTTYVQVLGRVLFSNEKENVCTVIFSDRNGYSRKQSGVPVRIDSANSWFPRAGDIVQMTLGGETPYIIGPNINDYNADVRQKDKMLYEIFSDTGMPAGNQIG